MSISANEGQQGRNAVTESADAKPRPYIISYWDIDQSCARRLLVFAYDRQEACEQASALFRKEKPARQMITQARPPILPDELELAAAGPIAPVERGPLHRA